MSELKLSRFYKCHVGYLDKYTQAKNEFEARRADLLRSVDSLISHPDITNSHKQYLLRFRGSV